MVANSYAGNPYTFAIARAAGTNESVQMLTAGIPARSNKIPSAKLAALQEPQSPIPATTKSLLCRMRWIRLSSTGVPK